MDVDYKTLLVFMILAGFLELVIIALEYTLNKKIQGIGWWVWGLTVFTASYMVLYLETILTVSPWLIVLANLLLVCAYSLIYTGILRFLGKAENKGMIITILAVVSLVSLVFNYGSVNNLAGEMVTCLAISILALAAAWTLLTDKTRHIAISSQLVSWILFFQGALYLLLMILNGMNWFEPVVFNFTVTHPMVILVLMVMSILLVISLVIMINQRLNNELREAKERFELIFNASPDAAVVANLNDEKIVNANDGYYLIFGLNPHEVIGRSTQDSNIWQDPGELKRLLQEVKEKKSVTDFFSTFKRKDGRLLSGMVSSRVIQLEDSPYVISLIRDVSKIKESQDKLSAAYDEEKKLRQSLEKEAQARIRFIDELAHELKGPLTPIFVSTEMLREMVHESSDAILQQLADNIYDGTNILIGRLEELLDVARFARGSIKLNISTVEPGQFFRQAAARYAPSLNQRRQRLITEISEDLPKIQIDSSRLEQVMINLLSNASKYSPDGSRIWLGVQQLKADIPSMDPLNPNQLPANQPTSAGSPGVGPNPGENAIVVSVKDEGIGITPLDQANLFQPYQRVSENQQKIQGLGLGLTVVKYIVEAHSGHLQVKSEPGRGSTFSFTIPVRARSSQAFLKK
jgi:PAS domain S-box-containing protein